MNKINSFKVSSVKTASAVEVPVNHIFVIDCSGSMCYDLPKIRTQLKNKLPSLVKKDDTVSLVWFSGKGEFGKLVERVNVNDLNDLNRLNTSIDRWLNPMGCTGFVEPLRTVKDLHTDNGVYSMMFLTDGCDNEWSRNEILTASEELASLMANAVFVEYGYYCNHELLTQMAEKTNGSLVFAEDFDKYDPIFDGIVKRKITTKRIEIEVGNPAEGFVWSCSDAGAISYKVEDEKVYVPEDVDEVYWFDSAESTEEKIDWKPLYQGLSALVMNRKSEFVKKQLSDIGDVALYNQYANSFGKQNLYDFAEKLKNAGEDESLRFTAGKKVGIMPDENAYTVLEMLYNLHKFGARVNLKKLKYNRIGRSSEMSTELSKAETLALANGISESSNISDIKKLTDSAMKLAGERSKMKFASSSDSAKISSFTYNETRPNVSMLFNIKGTVGLPSDAPSVLPKDFATSVFRNYTVIKDGLLNIEELPVSYSSEIEEHMKKNGIQFKTDGDDMLIDLRSLPVINARMVRSVRASELADTIYRTFVQKASIKVYKAFLEELQPAEKSQQIKSVYGDDVAEYLKALGITDSGYSPKTTLSKATDKYTSVEFAVKFKGLSTIPSYNAFKKKIDSGKSLNAGESLLNEAYNNCVEKKSKMTEAEFVAWLKEQIALTEAEYETAYQKIVESKFSILIGQTWFSDLDANSTHLTSNGVDVEFAINDTEVEI